VICVQRSHAMPEAYFQRDCPFRHGMLWIDAVQIAFPPASVHPLIHKPPQMGLRLGI
jgi:hypothetical protein